MQLTTTKLLELTKTHLNWDIRRQRFTIVFILALIAVRTVNLTEIAVHIGGVKRKLRTVKFSVSSNFSAFQIKPS